MTPKIRVFRFMPGWWVIALPGRRVRAASGDSALWFVRCFLMLKEPDLYG